jgi:hypothetical protein
MALVIKKAVKFGAKARIALYGPSGSGKTYTALSIAREMAGDKRVIVIDTERGSASKYADTFDFDVIELDSFHPNTYVEAIKLAAASKEHSVLVIDSLTHEWDGSKGALELAGKDFTNWSLVTPLHNKFIDAVLAADIHVIATMRAKEEHVMEKEEGKKAVIRKMGIQPIQGKNIQYEFDVIGALEMSNEMGIEKTRCSALKDLTFKPGQEKSFVQIMQTWLSGASAPIQSPVATRERLNALYDRGKKAGLYITLSDFAAQCAKALEIASIDPKTMTEAQAAIVDDYIARMELQAASERVATLAS